MSSSPSSLSLKLGEPTVQVVLHSSAASVFSSAKSIVQRRFDKMCVLSGSSSKRDKIPRYYHCPSFTTLWLTRDLSGVAHLFQDTFHSSRKKLISYWSCRFTNFNLSFEKTFYFHKYSFFALNVLHVFDSNFMGKAHIKKSST